MAHTALVLVPQLVDRPPEAQTTTINRIDEDRLFPPVTRMCPPPSTHNRRLGGHHPELLPAGHARRCRRRTAHRFPEPPTRAPNPRLVVPRRCEHHPRVQQQAARCPHHHKAEQARRSHPPDHEDTWRLLEAVILLAATATAVEAGRQLSRDIHPEFPHLRRHPQVRPVSLQAHEGP